MDASFSPSEEKDAYNVALICRLAALHFQFGRLQRAIKLLNFALWINPKDSEVNRLLAVCYYRGGLHARAIEYIDLFQDLGLELPEDLEVIEARCIAQI